MLRRVTVVGFPYVVLDCGLACVIRRKPHISSLSCKAVDRMGMKKDKSSIGVSRIKQSRIGVSWIEQSRIGGFLTCQAVCTLFPTVCLTDSFIVLFRWGRGKRGQFNGEPLQPTEAIKLTANYHLEVCLFTHPLTPYQLIQRRNSHQVGEGGAATLHVQHMVAHSPCHVPSSCDLSRDSHYFDMTSVAISIP